MTVGYLGTGTFTVSDGASVTASGVSLSSQAGSTGTLNLNGTAVDGRGVLATGQILAGAGTPTLNFDGGVLKATADQADFLSGFTASSVEIKAGGAFIDTNGFAVTITTNLDGNGSLTKQGEGTLTLSGTSTYEGGTVLEAGTLSVSSDANLGTTSGGLTFSGGTLATTATFTSARAVNLASTGAVNTASGTTLTLSGTISGDGSLTKAGAGTLILTGTNTYTGITTVNAGTLQIGDGGSSGSVVSDVVNNSALVFNRTGTYSFPGTITGSGTVTFIGGGTVEFSDPGAYAGSITVDNSALHLETGSQTNSTFTLEDGGTISGNGTIGGLVVNSGGIAAPGNSPGTIVVTGAVTFNSGSVYRVDVTPTGEHDLITATGAVTLSSGATVQVVAEAGVYAANTTYAIITTTGTVTGTFGSVTSNYAFLTPSLSYDAQNVYLTLLYNNVDFASYATTANERGVAVAAQALGSGNAIYDAILALSAASVPGALDALNGEIYASADTVIQQQSVFVREAVGARLRQSVEGPVSQPLGYAQAPATAQLAPDLTPTLWAQGYGACGNSFGDGNAASISSTIGGFLIGADVAVADNARAGVFGGYSRSTFDVDTRASSGDMDSYDVGLYAGAQFGAFATRGSLAYAWHDVSVDRNLSFPGFLEAASGDYSLGSLQVFGEFAYDMSLKVFGQALDVEPFVGLAYLNLEGASFNEFGGSAVLSVDLDSMDSTYATLGVRAATRVDLAGYALTPSVSLGWQHAFGDTTPNATMLFSTGTLPFQVSGVPIVKDSFLVEAGLGYGLSEHTRFSLDYSGQIAGAAAQNALTARLSTRF